VNSSPLVTVNSEARRNTDTDRVVDEYQGRENSKHVLRAMNTVEDIENRRHRTNKRLAIDPVDAETARLIFRPYLEGDGISGPFGVKEVDKNLDARGIRTRLGARCYTSASDPLLARNGSGFGTLQRRIAS
jgi:hypothetical protein